MYNLQSHLVQNWRGKTTNRIERGEGDMAKACRRWDNHWWAIALGFDTLPECGWKTRLLAQSRGSVIGCDPPSEMHTDTRFREMESIAGAGVEAG